MTSQSFSCKELHVNKIPYVNRKNICRILDLHEDWKELGGNMNYSTLDIQEIENESCRRGSSPTDSLLTRWGHRNHRVPELFKLLYKMEHRPAMEAIKDLVDPVYHKLLENNLNTNFTESDIPIGNSNNKIESINNVMMPFQSFKGETSSIASPSTQNVVTEITGALLNIPYAELTAATANWDTRNILGKGGFGVVYKDNKDSSSLRSHLVCKDIIVTTGDWKHTAVAIKRLKSQINNRDVSAESLRELQYLSTFRHDNILPLYGYSSGGEDKCLIYQLMPGGSLEERLKCRGGQSPLLWKTRLSLAQGVAKGLQYLHTLSTKPLIHGDIKSANILLDSSGEPRIGDFGLARLGPDMGEHTHLKVSKVNGTPPYLPGEFLREKRLSTKVDVYSFGIVIFELLTGLPAYDSQKQKLLKDYVLEFYTKNCSNREQLASLQDKRLLEINEGCPELGEKLFFVGRQCVQNKPQDRPDMVSVWQDLMLIQISI